MKDYSCGMCASFDMSKAEEKEPEIPASSPKLSITNSFGCSGQHPRQLEVIIEKEEETSIGGDTETKKTEDGDDANGLDEAREEKESVTSGWEGTATVSVEQRDKVTPLSPMSAHTPTSSAGEGPKFVVDKIMDIADDAEEDAAGKAKLEQVKPKPGPEEKKATPRKGTNQELDFDVNPSELYLLLQRKEWRAAAECAKKHPEQATCWISRKELDGRLRWRLLPIHGAVIFGAPENVIGELLAAYPGCISCKDDQGMLPIHLSYRMGSPEAVVDMLLDAFPECVEVKDRKGRTPWKLAQTSSGPNKAAFLRCLERRRPSSPVASSVAESEAAAGRKIVISNNKEEVNEAKKQAELQEARMLLNLSPRSLSRSLPCTPIAVASQGDHKTAELEETVETLKKKLAVSEETAKLLLERIATLEKTLKTSEDTETHLATKIAALSSNMQMNSKAAEETEKELLDAKELLSQENEVLKARLQAVQSENEQLEQSLAQAFLSAQISAADRDKKCSDQSDEINSLKEVNCSMRSNVIILEEQLRKKMVSETSLVEQVSSLARQLSVATQDNEVATGTYTKRVHILEQEKEGLRCTVSRLSKKIFKVAEFLDDMVGVQEAIASKAEAHDKEMAHLASEHNEIVRDVKEQQILFEKARQEREQMAESLRQQEIELASTDETRARVILAVERHAEQIQMSSQTRQALVNDANLLRTQMLGAMESVTRGLPTAAIKNDDELIEQVIVGLAEEKTPHDGDADDLKLIDMQREE